MKISKNFASLASVALCAALVPLTANSAIIFDLNEVGGGSTNITVNGSGSFTATSAGSISNTDFGDPGNQLNIDYVTSIYNADTFTTTGNLTLTNVTQSLSAIVDRIYLDNDGGVGGVDDFRAYSSLGSFSFNLGDLITLSGVGTILATSPDPVTNGILLDGADTGDIDAFGSTGSFRLTVNSNATSVPEPSVLWMLGLSLVGLIGMGKKSVKLTGKYA
ncbi:MAG: hypothetical protein methR_P1340 [Methyloprofundus sp.]|nr:MAG: hypothetical protein methR_P1340 [Methyloprofundus sp.]